MSTTLVSFRSTLGNVWGDLKSEFARAFGDLGRTGNSTATRMCRPDMNMVETENDFVLTMDLPGISLEDLSIEVKGEELVIAGDRRNETETTEGRWHRVESTYGKFYRAVRLGHGLKTDNIDAEYRDGVLKITVPKAEEVKPRRIEIRA